MGIFKQAFIMISNIKLFFFTTFFSLFAGSAYASAVEVSRSFIAFIEERVSMWVDILGRIFFFEIFGFPFLVAWLVVGGVFFSLRLKFVNVRFFKHGIDVVRGRYTDPNSPGRVTHAQALFTAVSATVGLGNIAGVAIAIMLGGPGAVVWMMIAAFLGMSTKYAEVILGQKYRIIKGEHLYAGPFYYLKDGLKEIGYEKLGKILAVFAALVCILGAIGAGIMFQSNQAIEIVVKSFQLSVVWKILLAFVISAIVGFVLLGGIVRIAHFAEKIVPFMAVLYVVSVLVVLGINYTAIPNAILVMFQGAFSGNALYGGVIGAIVQGFKRAAFSNEAGMGSAPIAHAAAKTDDPVKEGCVALLEPFIDTIIICFMSGLLITVTGVYKGADIADGGIVITAKAFATVADWYPYILSLVVMLFAFSTMLTYCYYGRQAWLYLSKGRGENVCNVIFVAFIIVGGVVKIGVLIDLCDILFLSMAIPNLIGLYFLSGKISAMTEVYAEKLKRGELKRYK